MQRTKAHLWIMPATLLILCALATSEFGPLAPTLAYACPNCNSLMSPDKNDSAQDKTANDERARMGQAYNLSIMLMMPAPFLLAAGLFGMFYWHMKKNNLLDRNIASPKDESPPST